MTMENIRGSEIEKYISRSPSAKPLPESWLSTLKTRKFQNAQLTGSLCGLVGLLSCTLVPVLKAADKSFNLLVLVSRPSDLLHSSNATAEVLATTLHLPTPSG